MALTRSGRRYGLLGAAGAAYSAYNNASAGTRARIDSIPRTVRNGLRQGFDRFRAFSARRRRTVGGRGYASSFRTPNIGGLRRGGRRSFRSRRKGGRRGRRGRPRRKGKSLLSLMWRKLCTPMGYHSTVAYNGPGIQNQRAWMTNMLGGETFLRTLGLKHPSNFLFNTAQNTSSTAVLQDQGGTNWKMSIDRFIYDYRIQNRSNASMELKIYECRVRKDVVATDIATTNDPAGIFTAMFNRNTDTPLFIGQNDSALGPAQSAVPTGLTRNFQHPAFTPYQSPAFVEYFKILKCHSLKLSPNEIVTRKFKLSKKLFTGQQLVAAASNEWQRNWSKILLFTWVGMPVDDGTLANQGKAVCDLFLQANIHVNYHFLPGTTELENYAYTNEINGDTSTYSYNPAGFTPVIPASDTIQTIAAPADTTTDVHP